MDPALKLPQRNLSGPLTIEDSAITFKLFDYHINQRSPPELTSTNWSHVYTNNADFIDLHDCHHHHSSSVSLFGRTENGQSVCAHVPLYTYLIAQLRRPSDISSAKRLLTNIILTKYPFLRGKILIETHKMHNANEFHPDFKSVEPKLLKFDYVTIRLKQTKNLYQLRKFLQTSPLMSKQGDLIVLDIEETFISSIAQFLECHKLTPSSVIQIPFTKFEDNKCRSSLCDIEINVCHSWTDTSPITVVPDSDVSPTLQLLQPSTFSFDIEAIGTNGKFPDPTKDDNPLICICASYSDTRGQVTNYSLSLEPHHDMKNVISFVCSTEIQMLERFRDLVVGLDVDVFLHYNGNFFDWWYMYIKAQGYDKCSRFFYMGKLARVRCDMRESRYKKNTFMYNFCGRINLDVYQYIRKGGYNLDTYKLNHVAEVYLNQNKIDLPIKTMISYWQNGDITERTKVLEYCVQDAILPLRLVKKLQIIDDIREMARITYVFVSDLLVRGQMYRVLCQLFIFARKNNFVLGTQRPSRGATTYQGAIVLDVKPGVYRNVVTLDFAALYPSIIIALNLCYSTFVPSNQRRHPNIEYRTIQSEGNTYTFQRTIKGLLPQMLQSLLHFRKQTKQAMKQASQDGNSALARLLDLKQKAIKVSANSVYGFTGAVQTSRYPSLKIASCVTSTGRELIRHSQQMAGAENVVAGDTDSIFVHLKDTKFEDTFQVGEALAAHITARLQKMYGPAILLEFEKTYKTIRLMVKKHYVGYKFDSLSKPGKLDAKGVAGIRRSFAVFQRNTFWLVVRELLIEENTSAAIEALRNQFELLLDGKIPIKEIVLTVQLGESYKNPAVSIPLQVAKQVMKATGEKPLVGSRVQYVIIVVPNVNNRKLQLFRKVRALEALTTTDKVDYGYYIRDLEHTMTLLFSGYHIDIKTLLFDPILAARWESRNIKQLGGQSSIVTSGHSSSLTIPTMPKNSVKKIRASKMMFGATSGEQRHKPKKKKQKTLAVKSLWS